MMEKYESYKPSGIPWIGEIPSHWDTMRIKFYCDSISSGATPSTNVAGYWDGDIPWIPSGCCHDCNIDEAPKFITKEGLQSCSTQIIPAGTTVMAMTGATCSQVGFLTIDAATNQSVMAYRENKKKADAKFLFYLLQGAREYILTHQTGGAQAGIDGQDCSNLLVPLIPFDEQKAIKSYLDRKCVAIDKALASQEKKKKCLEELRRNIITKSVTQGINSGVCKKNTGVEWIGDIPQHWTLKKMKYLLDLLTDYDANGSFSDIAKNCNINNGNPYAWMVRMTDLEDKRYGLVEGNNYCDQATYKYLSKSSLVSGDIIIAKRGSIGKSYLVPKCDCPMTLAPNTYLLKTKSNVVNNRFLFYYLSSSPGIINLEFLNKSTTLGAIYKDDVKAMLIPLPKMKEQYEIVNYLDSKISKLEMMIESVELTIKKLYNYKQSLITEVVTGKRKVC